MATDWTESPRVRVARPPQCSVRMGTPNWLMMEVAEMALSNPAAASSGVPLSHSASAGSWQG